MMKNLMKLFATTATVFVLVLATEQPTRAQYKNIEHLYSGCGFLLAEVMYGTDNAADTSINLYSGCVYTSAKILY